MNTKLTLRLEEELIKSAKNHAALTGKSVSQMVADYFYLLDRKSPQRPVQLTPIVRALKGSLRNTDIDESDYKTYLQDRYL